MSYDLHKNRDDNSNTEMISLWLTPPELCSIYIFNFFKYTNSFFATLNWYCCCTKMCISHCVCLFASYLWKQPWLKGTIYFKQYKWWTHCIISETSETTVTLCPNIYKAAMMSLHCTSSPRGPPEISQTKNIVIFIFIYWWNLRHKLI